VLNYQFINYHIGNKAVGVSLPFPCQGCDSCLMS
jgi:hypothetical protein